MASKDVVQLFRTAMGLDAKVDAAKEALEQAIDARSVAVKAVYDANGHDSGPFSYKGKLFTIRKRAKKDEEGNSIPNSETYFFVAIGGESQLTTIE